ncbi:TPA: hypothetical protein QDB06_000800 [Burkholderia vietnamiensis]|nr:hypothetical protein [Burkholderia vietnamiensis]
MNIIETTDKLHISISYALKDQFRQTFKTAKWNPSWKRWEIANTTANKNKLARFQEVLDSTQAEDVAKLAEEVELTESDLSELAATLQNATRKIGDLQTLLERHKTLHADIASITDQIAAKNVEAKKKQDRINALKEESDKHLNSILANYSYQGMSVEDAIREGKKLWNYMHSGYSQHRPNFYAVQTFLLETYRAIEEKYGIKFRVIYECATANKNRYDRDYYWFTQDVLDPGYIEVAKLPEPENKDMVVLDTLN